MVAGGPLVTRVFRVHRDPRDHLENQGLREWWEILGTACQVQMEQMEKMADRVQKVCFLFVLQCS